MCVRNQYVISLPALRFFYKQKAFYWHPITHTVYTNCWRLSSDCHIDSAFCSCWCVTTERGLSADSCSVWAQRGARSDMPSWLTETCHIGPLLSLPRMSHTSVFDMQACPLAPPLPSQGRDYWQHRNSKETPVCVNNSSVRVSAAFNSPQTFYLLIEDS